MIFRQIQTLVNQKIGQGKAILITGPRLESKKEKNMPKAFAKAYPSSHWQIISPANYYEWLE